MTTEPGWIPTSPVMTVGPVLVTFGVPASTAKLCAVPSVGATWAEAARKDARQKVQSERRARGVYGSLLSTNHVASTSCR